jgi:hypothetical protein
VDSEQLLNLEERIRNSQSLVVPSDTLRGRVVSEILQRQSGQVLAGKLYRFCCIALICNACILMSVRSMDRWWNEHYQPVSSSELLCRAQQIQDSSHMEPAESLAEAYHQWKLQLASHWKNAAQE